MCLPILPMVAAPVDFWGCPPASPASRLHCHWLLRSVLLLWNAFSLPINSSRNPNSILYSISSFFIIILESECTALQYVQESKKGQNPKKSSRVTESRHRRLVRHDVHEGQEGEEAREHEAHDVGVGRRGAGLVWGGGVRARQDQADEALETA